MRLMPKDRSRSAAERAQADAARMVQAIEEVFADSWDEHTPGLLREALVSHLTGQSKVFEFILDHPLASNWRLKPDHLRPGNVVVCDYRLYGIAPRPEIDALNDTLEQIAIGSGTKSARR